MRTQKSVSFEVSRSFSVTRNAPAPAMPSLVDKSNSKKPLITISAPPTGEDLDFGAPRAAPAPPVPSPTKSNGGHSRRQLIFPFGHHHKKDDTKDKERVISGPIAVAPVTPMQNRYAAPAGDKPSPTPSLSPIMRFPVPPRQRAESGGALTRNIEPLTGAFRALSPSSTLSPNASPQRPHTATPGDPIDRSPTPKPPRPSRPISLVLPLSGSGKRLGTPTKPPSPSTTNSGAQKPSSLKVRSRRSSRSPSPASPPPKEPLPSPPTSATLPSSDTEGWATDASTTIGGWTTDASSRMGSIGTIPSLASRRNVAGAARLRANTIAVANASKMHIHASGAMSSGDELDIRKSKSGRADLLHCIPLPSRHSEKKELAKEDKPRPRAESLVPPRSPTMVSAPDVQSSILREDGNTQSLRIAHETFVRMLREKHATEKAELLKRIERLEKDARRREREIKGLRWLIMNSNTQSGAAEEQVMTGRLRSGSMASDFSIASSGGSRSSSLMQTVERGERGEPAQESPQRSSVEEGLKDLQDTVSDLIVATRSVGDHQSTGRPDSPPESAMRRSPSSSPDRDMRAIKQARRASSPVMSRPGGLGFDIPSIPGSDSDLSLGPAETVSIPSLSASNTSSSGLSVIPEVVPVIEKDGERALAKEERRASRILKRLSTASAAQDTYAANLKIGMSPSIEQVLDSTKDLERSDMDDVLRKLRAFSRVAS